MSRSNFHSRPSHRTSPSLDFPLLSRRSTAALLLSLRFGRGSVPVGGHLGLDFHAAVEFLLGDALFTLGIAFFLDRVEDAAEFC